MTSVVVRCYAIHDFSWGCGGDGNEGPALGINLIGWEKMGGWCPGRLFLGGGGQGTGADIRILRRGGGGGGKGRVLTQKGRSVVIFILTRETRAKGPRSKVMQS